MKEHPILFSTPMIHAILEGRKTMTRRIIKPQPHFDKHSGYWYWKENKSGAIMANRSPDEWLAFYPSRYGQPGDRLWVKETCLMWTTDGDDIVYAADSNYEACKRDMRRLKKLGFPNKEVGNWKVVPSIFMPRSASRIRLEITNIRAERLLDITDEDIRREGVDAVGAFDYKMSFINLWEKINGKGSWNENVWVWAIEFKV